MRFRSGEKAYIDVELTARTHCRKLSVTLYFIDEKLTHVFDTSTDLLGYGDFDLNEGDSYSCTFEVCLNLVGGTYSSCVLIYRRDIQTIYDRWEPATTIYVSSEGSVHGIAHCFPQVIRQDVRRASDAKLTGITTGAISDRKRDLI